jgi:acylphosphatase
MSDIIARRCLVSGRVQGVFFRASARQKAIELGCTGYAKNLPDGRVEVLAVGPAPAVHSLTEWLWQGPPVAQVTDVKCADVPVGELNGVPQDFAGR